jgi:O-succinylbenzoic acid--CoA ligase
MPDWLRQRASSTPARLALVANDARLTFAELDAAVDQVAAGLAGRGVKAGEVVAVLAWNSAAYVQLVHAIARLGAVLLPLNARLASLELFWQLKDADARLLIHDAANVAVAAEIQAGLPLLEASSLEGLLPSGAPAPAENRRFDLAALHTIVYTSGTTGRPKGTLLTYGNHYWSALGSTLNLGLLPDDRWLACLPLFHVGGLAILLRSVIYGIPCLIHESFDAERVNQAIDDEGVTIVSVVSTMLERILDARAGKPYPPSFRCALLGGGPASRTLLERAAALGVPVVQTYGLTETASQLTTLAPEDALTKLGSAGRPLFGSEVMVAREDGTPGRPDEPGEILVRGPTVMAGYLNRPDETAAALRDGWLHTGDIGYLDGGGYLYVLDRRDDLIISGGENVYPAEVEAVIQSHPAIAEAGVFGVDDAQWGQAPAAVVVLRPGRSIELHELVSFCSERLARFKVPSRLAFARQLPRTASGKLLRRELRERWGNG